MAEQEKRLSIFHGCGDSFVDFQSAQFDLDRVVVKQRLAKQECEIGEKKECPEADSFEKEIQKLKEKVEDGKKGVLACTTRNLLS